MTASPYRSQWTDERLDRLAETVEQITTRLDTLTTRVDTLTTRVDTLTSLMSEERDRHLEYRADAAKREALVNQLLRQVVEDQRIMTETQRRIELTQQQQAITQQSLAAGQERQDRILDYVLKLMRDRDNGNESI